MTTAIFHSTDMESFATFEFELETLVLTTFVGDDVWEQQLVQNDSPTRNWYEAAEDLWHNKDGTEYEIYGVAYKVVAA